MLEGLASWVLKTYIGKYVNVNAHKLSVGLLSGLVELENVPFIPEAFNENDLPFELKYGYIGKIKLKISLNALRYTPLVLTVENFYLIIGPRRFNKQTKYLKDEEIISEKTEKLNSLENKWFKEVEFLGITSTTTGGEEQSKLVSIFGQMAYSLINNIHLNLSNFHVRYEDDVHKFSIGFYIGSILFQNNNDYIKTSNEDNLAFKMCELNYFSTYTDSTLIYDSDLNIDDFYKFMSLDQITNLVLNPEFKYIINPTSFKSQIVRDTLAHPLRKRNKPRIKVLSDLKQFHLTLNTNQIENLFKLVESINVYKNNLTSRTLQRPDDFKNENDTNKRKCLIKNWWLHLYHVIRIGIKKPTMADLVEWSKDVNIYKKIYMNILKKRLVKMNSNLESNEAINSSQENIEQEINMENEQLRIESKWNFKRLIKLRRLIFENFIKSSTFKDYLIKLKISSSKTIDNTSNYLGVYGYLSWRLSSLKDYYFSNPVDIDRSTEIDQQKEDETISENRLRIDQIEYNKIDDEVISLINDSIENNSLLKRDTLLASLEFKLDEASILLASHTKEIAELKFVNSTFLFEILPRHDSYLFKLNLGTFYLKDCSAIHSNYLNQKQNFFTNLIYPKNSNQNESVFQFAYEYNPFQNLNQSKKKFHGAVCEIQSCGLEIVYNLDVIQSLLKWFEEMNRMRDNANSVKIEPTKNDKNNDITNLITPSLIKKLVFNFEINGPKFLFPHDFNSPNAQVVILDFGRFLFKNRDINKSYLTLKQVESSNEFNDDEDDDDDEIYETPSSTPPPQLESVIQGSLTDQNFYTTYDLSMNNLQILIGHLKSDNIAQLLKRGHSNLHILDKFDINTQIDICKLKLKQFQINDTLTPIKIKIDINLLKIHIDDLQLISMDKTFQSLQKLFQNRKQKQVESSMSKLEVWKVFIICLDLSNVSIELLNNSDSKKSPLASLSFIKSSLLFEINSDQSKLIDLVSNEIQVFDNDTKKTPRFSKNIFSKILCNSKHKNRSECKSLQFELHYRSNRISNRYSIVINNCRVIAIFEWFLKIKKFFMPILENHNANDFQLEAQLPLEIKLNLNNTDLVLVENTNDFNSQAVILRLTAFIEYNQRKMSRPFESSFQSVELFSCQMSAIEKTALSIVDPVSLSINLTPKNSSTLEYEIGRNNLIDKNFNLDFILDISTEKLKLRFSYLDFKLFIRLLESIQNQIKSTKFMDEEKVDLPNKNENFSLIIHSIEVNIDNLCICIIDDCKDVDIPLSDIQFCHLKCVHKLISKQTNEQNSQGSAEFALNIDYYNRLLSGWEPLIEPWLARLNWKLKEQKNCFTLTSIDYLNINITNPFIELMKSVISNWKDEYNNKTKNHFKRHKIFQPYKLINLTGERLEFCTYQDTNTIMLEEQKNQELDLISSKWIQIDDKCEKQFNFYETSVSSKTLYSNYHYAQRSHNYQLRELVQHRIRVKLNNWSEIKPLTIDKVGHFFRDISRTEQSSAVSNSVTRLIFDISLTGNATKLIKIKSPMSIKNHLNYKIQCRIEPFFQKTLTRLGPLIVEIDANSEISIPIKYLPCNIWFRPLELGVNKEAEFSSTYVNCNQINQSGQVEYFYMSSKITSSKENFIKPVANSLHSILGSEMFYFFAKIKRLSFSNRTNRSALHSYVDGHLISIEPAFTLYNLLPIEFRYKFISTTNMIETNLNTNKSTKFPVKQKKKESVINGKLNSNKNNHFSSININNSIDLLLDIDNFRMAKAIEICAFKHLNNLNRIENNKDTANLPSSINPPNLTLLRRVNFYDEKNRPLFLIARIIFKIGSSLINKTKSDENNGTNDLDSFIPCPIEVHISTVYCFFNLTGLPLIFCQFNCEESAGQLEEHELASSNQPLLFSFIETDSPYACSMRIGKYCNNFKSYFNQSNNKKVTRSETILPKWCKPFGLEGGSSYRELRVMNKTSANDVSNTGTSSNFESSSTYSYRDLVYYIGIEIKKGKGLLRDTTFVYFCTRYYLVNKSSHNFLVAQYFSIQNLREQTTNILWENISDEILFGKNSSITSNETESSSTSNEEAENFITLLNDSMTQFHWPRTDKDQLLSIRLKSNSNYNWSGGFKIDNVDSFYLNMRHKFKSNDFFFIRVEVILDGGTFFIVFSETNDFPPPITIQNQSLVPIYFYQSQSSEEKYTITVKSNQSVNYSWDEPILEKKLAIGVNGGTTEYLDFSLLEDKKFLFYDNFIYVVFTDETNAVIKQSSLSSIQFVLTAVNNRVYIDLKESGNRDQLWKLAANGYLIHEGSSPPRELNTSHLDLTNCYVLDIDDVAPRPNFYTPLTLRRPDIRRNNTQKWFFQKDGFLCCDVRNMCVQIEGSFKPKARVTLGPAKQTSNGFLKIQVCKEHLRPGSGYLSIEMLTDGPTRLLKIENVDSTLNEKLSNDEIKVKTPKSKTLETYINLTGGIGISLIHWFNQEYEELLYGCLKSLDLTFDQDEMSQKFTVNVQSVQICNQLIDSTKQNLLYINNTQNFSSEAPTSQLMINHEVKSQPALHIDFLRLFKYDNIITIKHLIFRILDFNLQIEEKLLWKLTQMLGFDKIEPLTTELYTTSKQTSKVSSDQIQNNESNESDSISLNYYKSRINSMISNSKAIKFSFNKLQIDRINMTLSVYKTLKLSSDLMKVKSSLGIPLIQFENARIDLKAFVLMNEHDTASCILNLIKKHYEQALRENAIRILGSVDFLGNPLGFVVNFKESLTNVLSNGQVTDFVFSVTNSVANSVSKFSGFLSNELNELTLDDRHRETRDQIRTLYSSGSIDHFVGGALGFAVGIVGGALSLATQTYRGFYENGVTGAFAGLGKGVVGTVSKPIVGMLDFTNGIASAIRETSKTSYNIEMSRIRETRCYSIQGGLLTPYSTSDAEGQKILYQMNGSNLNEKFISMEQLNSQGETTISIITNQRIIIIKRYENEYMPDDQVTYSDLKNGNVIEEEANTVYLELILENEDNEIKRKKIRLENKQLAQSFAKKIRFAKADFDETFYSLQNYRDQDK